MRKRSRSDLRAPRALCLEIFEERCLLSGASSLLAAPLAAPVTTSVPIGLISSAVQSLGLTGATTLPNALPGAASTVAVSTAAGLNVNAGVQLNRTAIVAPLGSNVPFNVGPAWTINVAIGLGNPTAANAQVIVTGSMASIVPVPTFSSVTIASHVSVGADLKLSDAGGGQPNLGPGSVSLSDVDITPAEIVGVSSGTTARPSVHVELGLKALPAASASDIPRPALGQREPRVLQHQANVTADGPTQSWDSGSGASVPESGMSASSADTETLFQLINELHSDIEYGLARYINPADLAGQADTGRQSSTESTAVPNAVAVQGSTGDAGDVALIPSPQSDVRLADLLPMDLASLEADLKAFLAEIEQLGGELSSLLRRMNLSPWLMAVAVAALAGEVARRLQQPQPRRLLACDGTTLAWFPDLSGPWSSKEL